MSSVRVFLSNSSCADLIGQVASSSPIRISRQSINGNQGLAAHVLMPFTVRQGEPEFYSRGKTRRMRGALPFLNVGCPHFRYTDSERSPGFDPPTVRSRPARAKVGAGAGRAGA